MPRYVSTQPLFIGARYRALPGQEPDKEGAYRENYYDNPKDAGPKIVAHRPEEHTHNIGPHLNKERPRHGEGQPYRAEHPPREQTSPEPSDGSIRTPLPKRPAEYCGEEQPAAEQDKEENDQKPSSKTLQER